MPLAKLLIVARTIADLEETELIGQAAHVAEALQYRLGDLRPLH